MSDLSQFSDPTVQPGMQREVLPAGDYIVWAQKIELTAPKSDPDGRMLVTEFEVVHGPYRKRRIWDRMLLGYPKNSDAERLGRIRFTTFSHAAIGRKATDSAELLFKAVVVTVNVRLDKKYGPTNDVRDYEPVPPGTILDIRSAVDPRSPEERAAEVAPAVTPRDALDIPAAGPAADTATQSALAAAIERSRMRTSSPSGVTDEVGGEDEEALPPANAPAPSPAPPESPASPTTPPSDNVA